MSHSDANSIYHAEHGNGPTITSYFTRIVGPAPPPPLPPKPPPPHSATYSNPTYFPKKIKMRGWNPNGLLSQGRLSHMLGEATRKRIDILFIQEHNFTRDHSDRLSDVTARAGFVACVGYAQPGEDAGGTMILFRKDTFGLTAPPPHTTHLGGRVTVATMQLFASLPPQTLECVYAPAQPEPRRTFFLSLKANKVLSKGAISQGDWNVVPNISRDVRQAESTFTTYANAHAPILNRYMASLGQTDIWRAYAGSKARLFTRERANIATRLDRWYAPFTHSQVVWEDVGIDATFCASRWDSDHHPISATIAPLDESNSKVRNRIDPSVLSSKEVRNNLKALLDATLRDLPPAEHGWALPWTTFKSRALRVLEEETRDKKRSRSAQRTELEELELELQRVAEDTSAPPSATRMTTMYNIRERLRDKVKKLTPSKGASAFRRLMGEEISSKQFYRLFKAKHASAGINELYKVKDWDNPKTSKSNTATTTSQKAKAARKYYKHLYSYKSSTNRQRFIELLNSKRVTTAKRELADKRITITDITNAIRNMANGKSPGPDSLPAEFYKALEADIAPILLSLYDEIREEGLMPDTLLDGEMALLYKKKDPRDIRNYRPITLLNVDYKILSSILASRIKVMLDDVISPYQNGFVPGRQIYDNSYLTHLIKGTLDETNEEGLAIFIDCYKAFDVCAWDYLEEAAEAIGFGSEIRGWMALLYNKYNPPRRRIRIDGELGPSFPILSGVPQGDPLAPLIFLLVTEALSRAVTESTDLTFKGITIGNATFKISQFADDTTFYLRNYAQLPAMWALIRAWESATGMRVNDDKTEGLRLGRYKGTPAFTGEGGSMIKWSKPDEYIISLGIPISESGNYNEFFDEKYIKCKTLLSHWNLSNLTIFGRGMIANSLIYSRFRYYAMSLAIPPYIHELIQEDVTYLLWSKLIKFDAAERGSITKSRKWLKLGALIRPKRELGAGLLDWPSHIQAIQSYSLLRYLDGTGGGWKLALDHWFNNFPEGRGAIFTTIEESLLTTSTTYRRSGLPRFFREALENFRLINWEHINDNYTEDEARAIPVWCNSLFTLTRRNHMELWTNHLNFNKVRDIFIDSNNEIASSNYIIQTLQNSLPTNRSLTEVKYLGRWIKLDALRKQWEYFTKTIPLTIINTAKGIPPRPNLIDAWRTTAPRGLTSPYQQLIKMGWTPGAGLGINNQGIKEPLSNDTILGKKTKVNNTRKPLTSRFRGIVDDQDDVSIVKVIKEEGGVAEVAPSTLSPLGRPVVRGTSYITNSDTLRRLATWGRSIIGIAESTYPHPDAWAIAGLDKPTPMFKTTIKMLTTAFRQLNEDEPTCKASWSRRTGADDLPWEAIATYLSNGLLTPKDYGSWFKNILHGALAVRKIFQPSAPSCRMCRGAVEELAHFSACPKVGEVLDRFDSLTVEVWKEIGVIGWGVAADGSPSPRTIAKVCLGVCGGRTPPGGFVAIFLIMWKFIIIAFTRIDLDRGIFDSKSIWESTLRRLIVRVNARAHGVRLKAARLESRGDPATKPPNALNKRLYPIASINHWGTITWAPALERLIKDINKTGISDPAKPTLRKVVSIDDYLSSHRFIREGGKATTWPPPRDRAPGPHRARPPP